MQATKVQFHRLHKFVEGGVAFTPAQIAAATYKLLVGSKIASQQSYPVPSSLLAGLAPQALVTVPFSAVGFTPIPGIEYHVSVIVTVDNVDSPASTPIVFTNSLTPAAVDTVSVS